MASVVISGDTSGAITLQAPAVSGNTTLNLPASSGTVLTQNSSAPANSFVVDASGNVGVGTSSPAAKLNVETNSSSTTIGGSTSVIAVSNSNGSSFNLTAGLELYGSGTVSGANKNAGIYGLYESYTAGGNKGALVFATNGGSSNVTERMRIDSSGNVLVGAATQFSGFVANAKLYTESSTSDYAVSFRSTATTAYGVAISYSTAPNAASQNFIDARDSSAQRFAVMSNGGIRNFSANNVNLSDERVKTNITPAKSYLDAICAIPVVTFKYKDQTDEELNLGVIAQEVDAVAPELIDHSGFGEAPEGESPYLAVYQTDLQYALMKSIQELKAIVDEQAEKIKALEAK